MADSLSLKIMAFLALIQGFAGLLRAFNWVQIGADLFGQGLLLLPAVGLLAVIRGLFIGAVALMYVLFVSGAFLGKSWARWICLTAVVINLLLVLSALAQGVPVADALAWSVIPLLLLFYLCSARGRDALRGAT